MISSPLPPFHTISSKVPFIHFSIISSPIPLLHTLSPLLQFFCLHQLKPYSSRSPFIPHSLLSSNFPSFKTLFSHPSLSLSSDQTLSSFPALSFSIHSTFCPSPYSTETTQHQPLYPILTYYTHLVHPSSPRHNSKHRLSLHSPLPHCSACPL